MKGRILTMEDLKKRLQRIQLFVLDMDGTIYLGDSLFSFTPDFLSAVGACGKKYCFFTNNSSKNRNAYLEKLAKMKIPVTPNQMLISTDVILKWLLEHHPGKEAYVVGTPDLLEAFSAAGIPPQSHNPDYVVLGFDTTLTYEKLSRACTYIRNGAPVYGVNPDLNCPVEGGFIPDCGAIAALVHASTGVSCSFFGKPSPHTLEYILDTTGYLPREIAVIGDRLYTDIAVADGTDVTSILVYSGETKPEDITPGNVQPDFVCNSIADLIPLLKKD